MYIAPNSTLLVCKDIPFDSNYESTMWFGDEVAQYSYFSDKAFKTYTAMNYIRQSAGIIDVKALADDLYDAKYICFQNTSFGGKWFYAFVNELEYINNNTTRIHYQLDVMQTWFFDYELNECFVEREHVADDVIGGHLVDEGLQLGEYVYVDKGAVNGFDGTYKIVVVTAFESVSKSEDGTFTRNIGDGAMYGGVYSGLTYKVFDTAAQVNAWLKNVTDANYSDGVLAIYMLPSAFVPTAGSTQPVTLKQSYNKSAWQTPFEYKLNGETYSITPKNNKLYSYPYNVLCITDQNGNVANYRCEYFENATMQFDVTVAMSGSPEAQIVPRDYKNIDGADYMDRMTMNNFPMCPYVTDSYRAYIAQNALSSNLYNAAGTVSQGVAKTVTGALDAAAQQDGILGAAARGIQSIGNAVGDFFSGNKTARQIAVAGATVIGQSAMPGITNLVAEQYQASTLPPQAHGSLTSIINMATGTQGFRCYRAHIHPTYVKIIDAYFTKYGYAIRRVKTPNTHVREHWTYTKTVGCTITGSMPASDSELICKIYDKGITFFTSDYAIKNQGTLDNDTL